MDGECNYLAHITNYYARITDNIQLFAVLKLINVEINLILILNFHFHQVLKFYN